MTSLSDSFFPSVSFLPILSDTCLSDSSKTEEKIVSAILMFEDFANFKVCIRASLGIGALRRETYSQKSIDPSDN